MIDEDPRYGELDLTIGRVQRGHEVTLRLSDPGSQAEVAPARGPLTIDGERLLAAHGDPAEYGRLLAAMVFADAGVRRLFAAAVAALERGGLQLRVRVLVEPSAADLLDLRWELLRDPDGDRPLATSERVLLSRFMRSSDWRPVQPRRRAELRAVVAVASPSDLAAYRLGPLDVAAEVARAREALTGVAVTVIGEREPCTLDRLLAALQGADIVYLLAHGVLPARGEPALFLQDDAGAVARVRGAALAERVAGLAAPPRLWVLASCESAGTEQAGADDGRPTAESALAPALADAGAAAVLAMQGRISLETVGVILPRFFRELLIDGQIDRALAVARAAARARPDHWMPALYLRLKGGKMWYEPRLTGAGAASQWTALCDCVQRGSVLPILGPDLDDTLFDTRALADALADAHGLPRGADEPADLARVCQLLAVEHDRRSAQDALQTAMAAAVARQAPAAGDDLGRQLDALVAERRAREHDPYRLLAELPAAIYVTASPETMLHKMLKAVGKAPEPLFCRWRATRSNTPQEPRPTRPPTPAAPLVFHVFGRFGAPDSLVVTEDDFFDFLIATSTYKLLPTLVRGSLTDNALLFLGFRLDDWTFRVLFRLIMNLEGSAALRKYAHVGVQIDPEGHSLADVERTRRYLEKYFASDRGGGLSEPPITLFWGSPADFLGMLRQKLAAAAPAPAAPAGDDSGWD